MVKMGQADLEELLEGILEKLDDHEKKISQLRRKKKSKVDKQVMKILEAQK